MNMLMKSTSEAEMNGGDTFAERAEWYYQKRPQLLALLKDLYNGYMTLLDRCNRLEARHRRNYSSPMLMALLDHHGTHFNQEDQGSAGSSSCSHIDWDAESSLSYQQPLATTTIFPESYSILNGIDEMVADLVMKNVDKDILLHQLGEMEQQGQDSSRKIELLKKLLDVLESERIVLLNENVRLGNKVTTLLEENKGLSYEVMFLKRKAGELARCVLKMREDHRVCMLTRKIEDLQWQIYGLEKRNKEYYQQLVKIDQQEKQEIRSMEEEKNSNGGHHVCCFQIEKLIIKFKKRNEAVSNVGDIGGSVKGSDANPKKVSKWWKNVKNMDLLLCGLRYFQSTTA